MRKLRALVTYDKVSGRTLRREPVLVIYTSGEPHPRDRGISIDLPDDREGHGRQVFIGLRTFERETGLRVRPEGKRKGGGK